MVIIAFLMLFAVAIGSLFYLWTRFHKFYLIEQIAGERKKLPWLLAAVPVLLLVLLFFVKTVSATIIALHLFVFWLLSDFIYWLVKKVSKKTWKRYYAGIAAILITTVYLCIGWYYAHHVYETDYTIHTTKDLGTEKLRIAMFADSHMGCTFDGDGFAEHVKTMQKTNPDVVVIVGDFVDDDSKKVDMVKSCKALGEMKTTYGVYYVFGNHDKGYFNSRDFTTEELRKELEKNGIMILEDENISLTEKICLIGRQDRSEEQREDGGKRKEMSELVANMDEDTYKIVLDHQPHDFAAQAEAGVDLVLCGHTHGGQMFPVGITGELSGENDKTYGLETRKNTNYIVTSGISDWAIKFKTAAIAEFVIIDVEGK